MKNIFYFKKICKIGRLRTEQFLYEIAKKYKDYDITIYYDAADEYQLKRLKQYVRCKQRVKGEIVKCDKAFFNFNLDMIEDVEAKEYYFVSHANFQELGYKPPINNDKLTHYIGVSQFAADKLEGYGKMLGKEVKAITCYNPLTLEPKEKVLRLVSAGRFDDKVKGGERNLKLVQALDRYCQATGRHYIWEIFSNPLKISINSPNVVVMQPRVDVRPYIADADWFIGLSDDMETYGYSQNEALGYGVPIVTTPLTVCNELPIPEGARLVCNWDMSNVDEVVKQMFENKVKPFEYIPPKDIWENILAKGESTYKEELKMKYVVRALDTRKLYGKIITDGDVGRERQVGEEWEVNEERLNQLLGNNANKRVMVEVVKKLDEEIETAVKEPEAETTKKTTTKKKAVKKTK